MEELGINRLKLLLLAFLVFTISSCVGTAAELHVQQGGNPIQAAVNSAHSGDTIIVDPGNYVGNIDISKMNDLNDLVSCLHLGTLRTLRLLPTIQHLLLLRRYFYS